MGNSVDAMPVVSQLKSAAQAAQGDLAGAEATQQRFIRQCPVVAQGTSAVQAACGDMNAARETQREFAQHFPEFGAVEGVPLVSQVKSAIQAAKGDLQGAEATQQAFIRRCPGIAQCTSAVQSALGDAAAAAATEQEYAEHLPTTLAGCRATIVPVVAACCSSSPAGRAFTAGLGIHQAVQSASSFKQHPSTSEDCGHCFLGESLLRRVTEDAGNCWVTVGDLRAGDTVVAASGHHIKIASFTEYAEELRRVVRISTREGSLTVTSGHRILVQRAGKDQTMPAEHVKEGDDVWCKPQDGEKELSQVTEVTQNDEWVKAYELRFQPDEEVESFMLPGKTVLSKGHKKQTRRGTSRAETSSVPDTEGHITD